MIKNRLKILSHSFTLIILIGFLMNCQTSKMSQVEIKKIENGYELYRNGKPYFIKGAGIESHYKVLAESGGNSIRVWGIDQWDEAFKVAEKYNLTVCAGMWLEQERQGFDYSDQDTVNAQFESLKSLILKYKDHPALLMWGVGNELDLKYTNTKVWDAIEQIAGYIYEVDGNHPTMTATAFIEKEEVEWLNQKCPHIDILGVNAYAGLPVVSKFLKDFGWEKPYILGEWGTFGHWEVPQTQWNEAVELTSHEKANLYKQSYKDYILTDPKCIGAYVFFWGAKQERTPTWYGMFLSSGEKTESVDVMNYVWKNEWPENRSPILDSLRLDGMNAYTHITLKPNSKHHAKVWAKDPDGDELKIKWEVLHETTDKRSGGDEEDKPLAVQNMEIEIQGKELFFQSPPDEGAYRLFVYIYDQKGSAAHANIPFYVTN